MTRRAGAVLSHRYAADARDLLGDLGGRQHAAEAGFGTLAELDLDGLHWRGGDDVLELLEVEPTVLVATAEVGRAYLEDEVAALSVVAGEAALAGVVHRAGQLGALVDGLDGRAGERAEAHGGDVDDRLRPEGRPSATRAAEHLGRGQDDAFVVVPVGDAGGRRDIGEGAVLDDDIALEVLDVVVGAEAHVVVLALARGVDPGALVAGEGPFLVVARDDVLAQLRADALQEEAQVAHHRVVVQQGVLALQDVVGGQAGQAGGNSADQMACPHGRSLPVPVARCR